MENKKPELIAYTKGLTVIPFEHVLSVEECFNVDGQLNVFLAGTVNKAVITPQDAQDFVDKYNNYLAFVEVSTIVDVGGLKHG